MSEGCIESGIKGSHTKPFLNLHLFLQLDLVRNLFFFLHEVEALWNDRVILVLVFADLHQDFDHVLHTMADIAFVQDSPEPFVDGCIGLGRVLSEESTNFSHEAHGNFDRVIRWSFQQENEDLKRNNFMSDSLVDKVSKECCRGVTDNLERELAFEHFVARFYALCRSF